MRIVVVTVVLIALGASLNLGQVSANELIVYTYDSFLGPADHITEEFKKKRPDVDVVFVAHGDAGEVLARVIAELETGGPTADVLVGIGDTQLPKALARNIFEPLDKALLPNLSQVPSELHFD